MSAGTVRQVCQPPVLAIAKLPTGVAVGLPSRTCTSPLTPAAAPDATRALKRVAPAVPKLTALNFSQSPLPRLPTSEPPPVSEQASVRVPDWALNASAWMVEKALAPPP